MGMLTRLETMEETGWNHLWVMIKWMAKMLMIQCFPVMGMIPFLERYIRRRILGLISPVLKENEIMNPTIACPQYGADTLFNL